MIQLNTEIALRSLGNNTKLYKKVLDKFVAAYEQAGTQVANHLAAQELQEAERLAHTIKGLAGSLGAEELVQASAALESAFKNSLPTPEIQTLITTFSATLAESITACNVTSGQME